MPPDDVEGSPVVHSDHGDAGDLGPVDGELALDTTIDERPHDVFKLTHRRSFADLLAEWLDDLGEQLMPDQTAEDEQSATAKDNELGAAEEQSIAASDLSSSDLEASSSSELAFPIQHLDSAIALLKEESCRPEENGTPSKSPSTRRRKRSIVPRKSSTADRSPHSLRMDTNLPDVNRFESPSPSTWSGSGSSHIIDRSYSPESEEYDDDHFFDPRSGLSPLAATKSIFRQHTTANTLSSDEQSSRNQEVDHASHNAMDFLVMSARVPDLPVPEEVLAGLGDWSLVLPPTNNEPDRNVQHPPDLHPASVKAEEPEDRYNEQFDNTLEEAYNAVAVFHMIRTRAALPLSHHLRVSMTRLPLDRRALLLDRLWTNGFRGQYYTMLASGPFLFGPPPLPHDETAPPIPAKSLRRFPRATSAESSSATAGAGAESSITEISRRPRMVQFGGVTAVSQRPPDPRKYAATVATSKPMSVPFPNRISQPEDQDEDEDEEEDEEKDDYYYDKDDDEGIFADDPD